MVISLNFDFVIKKLSTSNTEIFCIYEKIFFDTISLIENIGIQKYSTDHCEVNQLEII